MVSSGEKHNLPTLRRATRLSNIFQDFPRPNRYSWLRKNRTKISQLATNDGDDDGKQCTSYLEPIAFKGIPINSFTIVSVNLHY